MRFHLLGLADFPIRREEVTDGFAAKIVNLGRLLKGLGHTVIFYGGEGSEVACDEFVQCVSEVDYARVYGENRPIQSFQGSVNDEIHQTFNANCIREINRRKQPRDFLLCPGGSFHQTIADETGPMTVEPGIGYEGVFAKYRVFESYAWMHYVYGLRKEWDGAWYDAVIPNFFDPQEFPFQEHKEDYFLFVGRRVPRKGLEVAIQVTRHIGAKLIVAGPEQWTFQDSHVEDVGAIGTKRRNDLMGHARAVFMPTYYIEPFGNVAVEVMLCGTPVITTDWGAFTETINQGVTGFRCRTFQEFVNAAMAAMSLNPQDCRDWAVSRYSFEAIAPQYQRYFERLSDLWERGWYQVVDVRCNNAAGQSDTRPVLTERRAPCGAIR